jgi:hypothetical protein
MVFLLQPFLLQAQDTAPFAPAILEQEPAPGATASSPTPLIRIKFDDAAGQLQQQSLLVEVDRNDVSSLAQFVDGTLAYQPGTPLTAGSHDVRITGTTKDGKPLQEITWSFTVPAENAPKNWTFGLEPSVNYEYGLHQEGSVQPNRFGTNIAVNSQSTGNFQANATSNLQGQDTALQSGNEFDLANFSLNFAAGPTSVSVWDVNVNLDLLGIANLTRRGVLFQQKLPFLTSGFDAFSVRSESIFGFKHGLGVSDSSQRIDGGSFFFSPLSNHPQDLQLRVYYLRGENASEQGFNFGGVTQGSKGDATGFSTNTSNFSGQIRTEFYAAWSNFDFNAADGFDGNKDHAFLARVAYAPTPGTFHGKPSSFQTQIEIQDLGLFFKSIANPFFVSDRLGFNVNASWTLSEFGFTGGVSRFHDNIINVDLLPTVHNAAYTAGIAFNPISTEGPPKLPLMSLTATRGEQKSEQAAVGFLALHNIVDSISGLVALQRAKWNVNLSTTLSFNNDLNNRVPDTDTKNLTVSAILTPATLWNIGPSVSFTRLNNHDIDISSDQWVYSLTAGVPVLPEKLTLDAQASFSSSETSDQLDRNSNFSGTAQLSFHLEKYIKKSKGRQVLALRMSYNRVVVDAPFPSRQKGLNVFGLLDLSWPF